MEFSRIDVECALCGGVATLVLLAEAVVEALREDYPQISVRTLEYELRTNGLEYAYSPRWCTWCVEAILGRPLTRKDFRSHAHNFFRAPALLASLEEGGRVERPSVAALATLRRLATAGGEGPCPSHGGGMFEDMVALFDLGYVEVGAPDSMPRAGRDGRWRLTQRAWSFLTFDVS